MEKLIQLEGMFGKEIINIDLLQRPKTKMRQTK